MPDVTPYPKVSGWTRKRETRRKKRAADRVLRENTLIRFEMAGYRCECCGTRRMLVAHHVDRRGMGGSPSADAHRLENLRIVCDGPGGCHDWIHEDEARGRELGWLA